jgi:hypothetical protein
LRGCHGSAGREGLPVAGIGSDDLAGVDARANGKTHAVRFLQLLVQTAERGAHVDRGPDGAQCVVVVDSRDAEDRHRRVADELLHHPTVPLDLAADQVEVTLHHSPQCLRIERLAERCEVRDVREDDSDGLPRDHASTLGRLAKHGYAPGRLLRGGERLSRLGDRVGGGNAAHSPFARLSHGTGLQRRERPISFRLRPGLPPDASRERR